MTCSSFEEVRACVVSDVGLYRCCTAGGSATTSEFLSSVVNLVVLLHDSIIRSAARVPLDFVSFSSEFPVYGLGLYCQCLHFLYKYGTFTKQAMKLVSLTFCHSFHPSAGFLLSC